MYQVKCDRCGKVIGDGLHDHDDNEFSFTKKRRTRWGYDKRMHFCNKCMKDFDKFMGEKK